MEDFNLQDRDESCHGENSFNTIKDIWEHDTKIPLKGNSNSELSD